MNTTEIALFDYLLLFLFEILLRLGGNLQNLLGEFPGKFERLRHFAVLGHGDLHVGAELFASFFEIPIGFQLGL